mgnify:CR=1 FL=1
MDKATAGKTMRRKLKKGLSGIFGMQGKRLSSPSKPESKQHPNAEGSASGDSTSSSTGALAAARPAGKGSEGRRNSGLRIAELEAELLAVKRQRQILVASRLHEDWRRSRDIVVLSDGEAVFTPNVKKIDGTEYDIANLAFDELPEQFRESNLSVARFTCSILEEALKSQTNIDVAFVDSAAASLHEDWVKDTRTSLEMMEQTMPRDMLPFEFLPADQQEKVRSFVRPAIDVYRTFFRSSGLKVDDDCLSTQSLPAAEKGSSGRNRRHSMQVSFSPTSAGGGRLSPTSAASPRLHVDTEGAESDAMESTWRGVAMAGTPRSDDSPKGSRADVSDAWVRRKRDLRTKRAVAKYKATKRRLDVALHHSAELLAALQARDITIAMLHTTLAAAGLEAPQLEALDPVTSSAVSAAAAAATAATAATAADTAAQRSRAPPPPLPRAKPVRSLVASVSGRGGHGGGGSTTTAIASPRSAPLRSDEGPWKADNSLSPTTGDPLALVGGTASSVDAAAARAPAPAALVVARRAIEAGDEIEARWKGRERWFSAEIVAVRRETGRFDVRYGDGDEEKDVPALYVRRKRTTSGRTLPLTTAALAAARSGAVGPRPTPAVLETEELSAGPSPEQSPAVVSLKNAKALLDDGLITEVAFRKIKGELLAQLSAM